VCNAKVPVNGNARDRCVWTPPALEKHLRIHAHVRLLPIVFNVGPKAHGSVSMERVLTCPAVNRERDIPAHVLGR